MGGRINTIMQTCFFAISGVLPRDEAIAADQAGDREDLRQARRGGRAAELRGRRRRAGPPARGRRAGGGDRRIDACRPPVPAERARLRPAACTAVMHRRPGRPAAGQRLPGRRHLPDRHRAVGEAQHRRSRSRSGTRTLCIQCGKCALVCPHAVDPRQGLRAGGARRRARRRSSRADCTLATSSPGSKYTLQVAPEDCTGCALCVEVCPAKDKSEAAPQGDQHGAAGAAARARSARTGTSSSTCPELDRDALSASTRSRASQLLQPLFEFSGACAGCGETPYLKLLTPALRRPRC